MIESLTLATAALEPQSIPSSLPLELGFVGSPDDLAVFALPFGLVGEQPAELGEQPLPVAGHVLHPQVVQDEFSAPERREREIL